MRLITHTLKSIPIFALMLVSLFVYSIPVQATLMDPQQTQITGDELRTLEEQALKVRLTALEICDFISPSEESRCKTTGTFKRKRVCKEPHTATLQEVTDLINNKLRPEIKAMHATYDNKTFVTSGSRKRAAMKQKAWTEIVEEMKKIDEFMASADKTLSEPEEKLTLVYLSLDCHQIGWSALFITDDAYRVHFGRDPFSYGHWWWVPEIGATPAMP